MRTILFCLTAFLLAAGTLTAQTKPLVFVTQDEQDFPWVMGDSSSLAADKPGAAVELVTQVAAKLGIAVEVRRYPWVRCLEKELSSGAADGAFLASYKAEREAFGVYPAKDGKVDPGLRVNTSTYSFYKLKGTAWTWDGKTAKSPGGPVGVPGGYSVKDDLKKLGLEVIATASTEINFKNLVSKRLALVATLEMDGDYLIETNPAFKDKIVKVETPIAAKPYYIMLSKAFVARDPALAARIWAAAAELRESKLKDILGRYF